MSSTIGLGRSRRYRPKPLRRTVAEIGLIVVAVSAGAVIVALAIMGLLENIQ